jgi:putative lipoprotein
MVLVALGCAASLAGCQAVQQPELELGYWQLVALGEAPVETGPRGPTSEILFDSGPPQRVSGFNGCNRFAGAYVLAGENVEFRALSTTRMACGPAATELEGRFMQMLDATRGWRFVEGELVLLDTYGRAVGRFELRQP